MYAYCKLVKLGSGDKNSRNIAIKALIIIFFIMTKNKTLLLQQFFAPIHWIL